MKPGGGKAKGAAFERMICKRLSLWLSRGMHDDYFWRSAMSGGRASVQFKRGKQNRTQEGDISAIDPQGARLTDKFVIECKCVADLHIQRMMQLEVSGGISQYWETLREIAQRSGKWPMLVAKENNGPIYVVLTDMGWNIFNVGRYCVYFPLHHAKFFTFDDFLATARRP